MEGESVSGRSAALDWLRALAVVLVICRHLEVWREGNWLERGLQRGGWAGVDLFFALSGFLVSGLLFREWRSRGELRVGRFLVRRGLKIYPMFYAMLGASLAFHWWLFGGPPEARAVWGEALFLQNYVGRYWNHTWSLAVEEHFYLGIGLLAWCSTRGASGSVSVSVSGSGSGGGGGNPFRALPWILWGLGAVCLALRWEAWRRGPGGFDFVGRVIPTHLRIDSLGYGVLLGYWWHFGGGSARRLVSRRWARRCLALAGACCLAPAFVWELEDSDWMGVWGFTLFSWGSCALVLAAAGVSGDGGWAGRLAAGVGSRSYPIYLWHMPVIFWFVIPFSASTGGLPGWAEGSLALAVSLAAGTMVAAGLEAPTLRARDRWFPSRSGGAGVSAGGVPRVEGEFPVGEGGGDGRSGVVMGVGGGAGVESGSG